ncbi:MAG: hypothetical protein Q8J74_01905, partial [Candidatus Didemnitutus sp.]|nr:hypothetical protein [Candidatus Didemnitutus sp.]
MKKKSARKIRRPLRGCAFLPPNAWVKIASQQKFFSCVIPRFVLKIHAWPRKKLLRNLPRRLRKPARRRSNPHGSFFQQLRRLFGAGVFFVPDDLIARDFFVRNPSILR